MKKSGKYIENVLVIFMFFILITSIANAANNNITEDGMTNINGEGKEGNTGEYDLPNQTFTPLGITPMINLCYKKIPQGSTTYQDFGVWFSETSENNNNYDYELEIKYADEKDWITIYPEGGILSSNDICYHEILFDTSDLSIPQKPYYAGFEGSPWKYTHVAYVIARCNGYEATMEVRINVVKGPDDSPTLKYWPPALEFSKSDPDGTSKTFEIWNSGKGKIYYNLYTPCSWIKITPDKGSVVGETDTIKITINPSENTCGSGRVGYVYMDVNAGAISPPGKQVGAGRVTIWRNGDWPSDYNVGCNNSDRTSSNDANIGHVPDTPLIDDHFEEDVDNSVKGDSSEPSNQSIDEELEPQKDQNRDLEDNITIKIKNKIMQLFSDTKIYEIISRFLKL